MRITRIWMSPAALRVILDAHANSQRTEPCGLLLGYRVEETGVINNVHVMRSSGNAVLDQSAVRTLNNVGRIPASIWRGGTILDLQLPVIYKLTQG